MTEADLRLHLAKQTKKRIALFDILKVALSAKEARLALSKLLAEKPDVVLFDALSTEHLARIGGLLEDFTDTKRPLFSVGSSGIEAALAAQLNPRSRRRQSAHSSKLDLRGLTSTATKQLLVGSGSCSPVTSGQIAWALQHGFAEVALDAARTTKDATKEIRRCVQAATALLQRTGQARLLLVVDQFEEIFTLGQATAAAFQGRLLELIAARACYVVLTVRADFYPDLMISPLWGSIQHHRCEVLPLDAGGLRQAIIQPAQAVGVAVEPALVERLVADAAGEPGILPIVQETLRLLWDRLDQRSLTLGAYAAIILPGGARAATRNGPLQSPS